MSIKIRIPIIFQNYTDKMEVVEASGSTIGECFENIGSRYPELKNAIYTQNGKLASFIPVYKNEDYNHQLDLVDPVKDGDILSIHFMGGG
jgi:molybdopterin synthase sulfur carrier subunit